MHAPAPISTRGGRLVRVAIIVAGTVAFVLAGCGGDDPPRPPVDPEARDALFVEPLSYCLPEEVISDTLFIHNLGDTTLVWRTERVPTASTGLEGEIRVDPETIVAVVWQWITARPYPQVDTLVATTNDPDHPRVVIPFTRHAPDHVDTDPPSAPPLATPADGVIVAVGDTVEVSWGRVSDCSGIDWYLLQISPDPDFHNVWSANVGPVTAVGIIVEKGDVGAAYWRVRARDKRGLLGSWSEARTWTVLAAGDK